MPGKTANSVNYVNLVDVPDVPHPTFHSVKGSAKNREQAVRLGNQVLGTIWREQAQVIVSKLTEPRRSALKWRWFAKANGTSNTLGRGTRVAMLLGPGFKTKNAALSGLLEACPPPLVHWSHDGGEYWYCHRMGHPQACHGPTKEIAEKNWLAFEKEH